MTTEAKKSEVFAALQEIVRRGPAVIVGTGASMALDGRFGMGALSERLRDVLPLAEAVADDEAQWQEIVKSMDGGIGLETAIDRIQPSAALEQAIVTETGRFVATLDREIKERVVSEGLPLPLEGLLGLLARFAPPASPVVPVVTTNYDCLIEHACDRRGIAYTTGFVGGLSRHFDWDEALHERTRLVEQKRSLGRRYEHHIQLFKLHGSLDWFKLDGRIFTDPSLMYLDEWAGHRDIITPGRSKNKKVLQGASRDLLPHMDRALERASAYLFVGFGFNDPHVDDKAVRAGIRAKSKPGIVVTRDLNDNADRHLQDCKNLWAVCRIADGKGTRILRGTEEQWRDDSLELWRIDHFTREVLGA